MRTRVVEHASKGALAGFGSATLLALADYGAVWLWIPAWPVRLELFWRLLAFLLPLGGLIGGLLGLVVAGSDPPLRALSLRLALGDGPAQRRWEARLWPLPVLTLAFLPLCEVARLLFTGGTASKLPLQSLWVAGAALVLVAGSYVALRVGHWLYRLSGAAQARRAIIATLALGTLVGASKLDEWLLPKLYNYLHAGLTAAAFGAGLLGVLIALRRMRPLPLWSLPVGAVALLAPLLWNLQSLDSRHMVRASLLDPRASHARSLMLGVQPMVPSKQISGAADKATLLARLARERRARQAATGGLLSLPGAHLLLITVDALRSDHLGSYGYPRPISPAMDALARSGTQFDRAYAQAPHSSYSLTSTMTSEYLHEVVDLDRELPETTLADALRAKGYHTAAFYPSGVFHTEGERLATYRDRAFGFEFHDQQARLAEPLTDRVLEELDRIVEMGEPPTFLWVHYFDVHEPYRETSLGTSAMDRYDGEIRNADRAIGRLLKEVEGRLARDLVVALSADHGEEFRDHGGVYHGSSLYDEQVRVPLLLRVPGASPRRVAQPVELVDLAPTVLGLLEAEVPPTMRGDDLRPLLMGRPQELGPVFAGVMHKRMVLRWPHKLVADLRFKIFELYDLAADPSERESLADLNPERVDELRGEVYAWLDALSAPPNAAPAMKPAQLALSRGRLGDRRAVPGLLKLLGDVEADTAERAEGARVLGSLADKAARDALAVVLDDADAEVAREAAFALGKLKDERARELLRQLVFTEDPALRARAGISLAHLGDRAAVPALIDALWLDAAENQRQEAVRWLGRLGDSRAVEPLIGVVPEFRLRALAPVALGQIGDRRAYEPLVDMLDWEYRANIRDAVAKALGFLGDRRALPVLARLLVNEPELKYVGEALARLQGIGAGVVGGIAPGRGGRGMKRAAKCHSGPLRDDWHFLAQSWCQSRGGDVSLELRTPGTLRSTGAVLALLRLRRADQDEATEVELEIGGDVVAKLRVDGNWQEHRIEIPASLLGDRRTTAKLHSSVPEASLAIDHLLLSAAPPRLAKANTDAAKP